jgi:hypothetical protein
MIRVRGVLRYDVFTFDALRFDALGLDANRTRPAGAGLVPASYFQC